MATNVERLQEAGLLKENTNISQEYQDKINNDLSHGDVKCLIDVAEKLGLESPVLEHGNQDCGF